MKRIYLITRTDDADWYEYNGAVIVAKTPKQAKKLAYKGYCGSFKEGNIICRLIGLANKNQAKGDVLASFNAG